MELNFYTRPFRKCKYSGWVYDARDNFVFQFEPRFDTKGSYLEGEKEMQEKIIFSLNAIDHEPVTELNLVLKNPIEIYNVKDHHLITIRGWGNLTGVGAHNFPAEKAEKIQDDFVQYLLYKLKPAV